MLDGHLNKCKECTKKSVKKRSDELKLNDDYIEKERARGREKYHRLGYKNKKISTEKRRKILDKHNNVFPEKTLARRAVQRLKKEVKENQIHHWSYKKEHWKDVIEISIADHNLLHRYMIYDTDHFLYRSTHNLMLLETKQSHIDLLEHIKTI